MATILRDVTKSDNEHAMEMDKVTDSLLELDEKYASDIAMINQTVDTDIAHLDLSGIKQLVERAETELELSRIYTEEANKAAEQLENIVTEINKDRKPEEHIYLFSGYRSREQSMPHLYQAEKTILKYSDRIAAWEQDAKDLETILGPAKDVLKAWEQEQTRAQGLEQSLRQKTEETKALEQELKEARRSTFSKLAEKVRDVAKNNVITKTMTRVVHRTAEQLKALQEQVKELKSRAGEKANQIKESLDERMTDLEQNAGEFVNRIIDKSYDSYEGVSRAVDLSIQDMKNDFYIIGKQIEIKNLERQLENETKAVAKIRTKAFKTYGDRETLNSHHEKMIALSEKTFAVLIDIKRFEYQNRGVELSECLAEVDSYMSSRFPEAIWKEVVARDGKTWPEVVVEEIDPDLVERERESKEYETESHEEVTETRDQETTMDKETPEHEEEVKEQEPVAKEEKTLLPEHEFSVRTPDTVKKTDQQLQNAMKTAVEVELMLAGQLGVAEGSDTKTARKEACEKLQKCADLAATAVGERPIALDARGNYEYVKKVVEDKARQGKAAEVKDMKKALHDIVSKER